MASKKLKKALMAGLAGVAGAKMLGSMGAKKAIPVDTGDLGSEMANDTALASSMRKNMEASVAAKKAAADSSMLGRAKNFLKEEIFTTNPKTKVRDMLPKMGPRSSEQFGLEGYGAKTGKMIKANNGTMVIARGNKLARSKPTKLS
jgi:hypothetical protein